MNTTKRHYESMYVVDANLTDEQVDSIIAKYSNLIAEQGGEVNAVGRWDKRRLAYEVAGRREGLYILMFFEAEPAVAKELDRVYRISDDVFRHLITRVEPQHVDTSRIEQPQPSTEAQEPEVAEEAEEIAEEAPVEVVEEETAEEAAAEEPEAEPAETVEAVEEVEAPAEETAPEEPAEEAPAQEPSAEAESPEAAEGEEPVEEAAEPGESEDEPQA